MYKQTLPVPTRLPLPTKALAAQSPFSLKVIMLCFTLPLTLTPAIGLADKQQIPGFSATLEHRFKPLQQTLMRSDIVVSEQGYRVRPEGGKSGQSLIANMVTGNIWFVDQSRSMVHEVPLSRVEGAPKFPLPMVRLPGFIDSVPCVGQDGTQTGDVLFHKHQLQRWRCAAADTDQPDDELPVEQYFSADLSLVMYSLSANGLETQLLNINKRPVDSNVFSVPEGLHSVSIEEFMCLTPPIGQYQDAAAH